MLTHSIKISVDTPTPHYQGYQGNYSGMDWKANSNLVNNQEELDKYLEQYSWIKPGAFIAFERSGLITEPMSMHLIVEVITDWDSVPKYPPLAAKVHPKILKLISCNIDMIGNPSWERADNITGYRKCDDSEVERVINDHVRHRIQLFQEKHGYNADFTRKTNAT